MPRNSSPTTTRPDEHPDAPEADYLEQHEDVLPEYRKGPTIAPDVPEADALDQAIPVDRDDEALEHGDEERDAEEYDDGE